MSDRTPKRPLKDTSRGSRGSRLAPQPARRVSRTQRETMYQRMLYIGLAGQRAIVLIADGEPVGIALGVALIVLPLIALWAIGREVEPRHAG